MTLKDLTFRGIAAPRPAVEPLEGRTLLSMSILADVNPGPADSDPGNFAKAGSLAYFSATPAGAPRQLYRTDGTAAGTRPVSDSPLGRPAPALDGPGVDFGDGRLVFAGRDAPAGQELWITDGTEAGTRRIKDINPGTASSEIGDMRKYGDYVYFVVFNAPNNFAGLWRTDGTDAGTIELFPQFYLTKYSLGLVGGFGGRFYFNGERDQGKELFSTDGTRAGTGPFYDLQPGPQGGAGSPAYSATVNDKFLFTGWEGGYWDGLWVTNGTPEGTSMLQSGRSGHEGFLGPLTAYKGEIYYSRGGELWRTDGTPAGTVKWGNLPYRSEVKEAAVVGDTLYLAIDYDGYGGANALYKSDGTADGTIILEEFVPSMTAYVGDLTPVGDTLLFRASEGDSPYVDLWRSDGTRVGTVPEGPGPDVSYSGHAFLEVNGVAVFNRSDPAHGKEPWRWNPGPVDPSVVARHLFYNRSSYDGNNPSANAADDAAISPEKRALFPGHKASFSDVSSYTRGINGLMIDLSALPAGTGPTAEDFAFETGGADGTTWTAAPAPQSMTLRRGAGVGGADRVTFTFADNAIKNTWLRVTVKPTARTGLASPDVFYYGNLAGEAGDSYTTLTVNAIDLSAVRRYQLAPQPIIAPLDFDRNGVVNAIDLAITRANQLRTLQLMTAPPATSSTLTAATPLPKRRLWDASAERVA